MEKKKEIALLALKIIGAVACAAIALFLLWATLWAAAAAGIPM